MADPFSTAVSAVTVATVVVQAGSAVSKLKSLWDEVQDVPETITDLLRQLEILDALILEMDNESSGRYAPASPILFNDAAVQLSMDHCRKSMENLASIVRDLSAKISTERKAKRVIAKMKVILQKQALAQFEKRLQNSVSLLGLAQQTYMMALIRRQPHIILERISAIDTRLNNSVSVEERGVEIRPTLTMDNIAEKAFVQKQTNTIHHDLISNIEIDTPPWLPWYSGLVIGNIAIHRVTKKSKLTFHGQSETEYIFRLQLARWLTTRAWDIQVISAISGWTMNLRVWRIAPDSPAIEAVKNNNISSLKESLRTGRATLFDRTLTGDTLLHLAAKSGDCDITHLLVTSGLDFAEGNDNCVTALRAFIFHMQQQDIQPWLALRSDLLNFLTSLGALENLADDRDAIESFAWDCKKTRLSYEIYANHADIIEPYQPHVLPFMQDIETSRTLPHLISSPSPWSPQIVRRLLWKDGKVCKSDVEQVMAQGFPVWSVFAYFVSVSASTTTRKEEGEWEIFMHDVIEVTRMDALHTTADVPGMRPWFLSRPRSPLTPFLWLLLLSLDCWRADSSPAHFEGTYKSHLQPVLHRWLRLLKGCQVDLVKYGQQERETLLKDPTLLSYSWELPDFDYSYAERDSAKLRDIRYGMNPEDWDLVWDIESSQQDPKPSDRGFMPGGWPDESDS